VFKLTRNSSGDWTTTLLYSFKGASDGSDPNGALVFDRLGNLYGTTVKGGPYANGTVFQLAPLSNGTWAERVLYSFQALPDGQYPYAGLTFDTLGNLFGTTYSGGNSNTNGCGYTGCGVVFELKPSSGGKWAESVIYAFNGGTDGDDPYYGSLAIDAAGNLFGTTFYTGCSGCSSGTVFEISPNGSGGWTHFVIYSFTGGNDGGLPTSGVTLDSAGNLYGTTSYYGAFGSGTVFELKPSSGGWIESTLYSFTGGTDGARPFSGVVLDAAGNLYGTTFEGGTRYCPLSGYSGCGVVYKLAPGTSQWSYTSLYTFTDKLDGANPNAGVVLDGAGNLYGTTEEGGKTNSGVVFEVAP
jgi:uncharacterized repeat protein (TIGR03803 family)